MEQPHPARTLLISSGWSPLFFMGKAPIIGTPFKVGVLSRIILRGTSMDGPATAGAAKNMPVAAKAINANNNSFIRVFHNVGDITPTPL